MPFKGYIVWTAVTALVWTFVCACAMVPLFKNLFYTTRVPFDSNEEDWRLLNIQRFTSIVLLSLCRITQLALFIALTVGRHLSNFACVEFSFNRTNIDDFQRSPYSSPFLEITEAAFFPLFLLAGKSSSKI